MSTTAAELIADVTPLLPLPGIESGSELSGLATVLSTQSLCRLVVGAIIEELERRCWPFRWDPDDECKITIWHGSTHSDDRYVESCGCDVLSWCKVFAAAKEAAK